MIDEDGAGSNTPARKRCSVRPGPSEVRGISVTWSVARRLTVVAVTALSVVGLAGCSASSDEVSPDPVVAANEAAYRAAMQKAADCTAAKGWQVEPLVREADGSWSFSMTSDKPLSDEDNDRQASDSMACIDKYVESTGVWTAYRKSMLLTGAQWDQAYGEFVKCLNDAGVSGVAVGDSVQKVTALIPQDGSAKAIQAQACVNEYRFRLFSD